MEYRFFFVGGIFTPFQREWIKTNSVGVIQNAADVLQWGLLKGFDEALDGEIVVINMPFVGSYPKRFKKILFPKALETILTRTTVISVSFLNIAVIKYLFRFISLMRFLKGLNLSQGKSVFVIYSAHYPFLLAISIFKLKYQNVKICLVIPDLPEFMSSSTSIAYRVAKFFENRLFEKSLKNVDYFVTLTAAMQDKLRIPKDRSIVVEGIAHADFRQEFFDSGLVAGGKKIIFYSGTLAASYGIKDLVVVFSSVTDDDVELWICGDGDSKRYIEDAALLDSRIKYLGQLDRNAVLNIQRKVTLLVNPRTPEGVFTKYSFPSKILEYMLSGRPVLMHRLEGIPAEYYSHCFSPEFPTREAFRESLVQILNLEKECLNAVGEGAREFVLLQKSPKCQVDKIINLMKKVQ
jgi:glycosyltransferase involved in cell wall biosynthesis